VQQTDYRQSLGGNVLRWHPSVMLSWSGLSCTVKVYV